MRYFDKNTYPQTNEPERGWNITCSPTMS